MVRLLVESGADTTKATTNGETPFPLAKMPEIVELLNPVAKEA